MDKPAGFLESELERALAARAADDTYLVSMDGTRGNDSVREPERRFRELLDALPAAIFTTDAKGRLTYFNDAAADMWGERPSLGGSIWGRSWKLYWSDGTPMQPQDSPVAVALREDRPVRGMEAICERPDGTRVPFIPYPTPLHDEAGQLVGIVNMQIDITERKRAEDRQHLMVRELHHRVKNTLATVQAIMGSTARTATSMEDFQTALIGRIAALSKTHILLSDDSRPVSFGDIVHSELDAFDDGSDGRIILTGPPVEIPAQAAVPLSLAMHELTTNAAKYGALSVHGGKVQISWSETITAERRQLDFDWVESGGPAVEAPERQGFGTRLLQFVLPGQIQAKLTIDYRPEGVHVHGTVPLPAKKTAD
ncbi:MAG: HWE histidine kinase domain-containing protein [Pseudolabrys sp.]|nr:HWE histidine kinase domain-containing protein [Pseudolabrys sp.]